MSRAFRPIVVLAAAAALGLPAGAGASVGFRPVDQHLATVVGNLSTVATGDFDEDGVPDAVSLYGQTIGYLRSGDVPGTLHSVLGTPADIAVGDFDADGHLDVAVSVPADDVVGVFWGDGHGELSDVETYPTGDDPWALTAGDFNGDGRTDLAIANRSTHQAQVMLADPVARGFLAAGAEVGVSQSPTDMLAADANLDGHLDAVVSTDLANVAFALAGAGDGTLSIPFGFGANPTGTSPVAIAAGDILGNPGPDLVTANAGSGDVSILRWFNTTIAWPVQTQVALAPGSVPVGIATGTFTADGHDDVAVISSGANEVTVLTGSGGTLAVGQTIALNAAPVGVAAADFNGDGADDLLVTEANGDIARLLTQGTPDLAGTADTGVAPAATITDTVTLSGATPVVGGTLSFAAYGPDDPSCAGTPIYTEDVAVSGNDDYAPAGFTATHAGTYHWTVGYSGDTSNDTAQLACAAQSSVVEQATPSLSLDVPSGQVAGTTVALSATLADSASAGGHLTFLIYLGSACSGTAVYDSGGVPVSGDGDYDNDHATVVALPAGGYVAQVTYSGDQDNAAVVGSCEPLPVGQDTPSVGGGRATGGTVGDAIRDTVTLSGATAPSGSITFTAYADAACSGSPAFTSDPVAVSGAGDYTSSPGFTPGRPGQWHWVASYSGDADNVAASTDCADGGQVSTVTQAGVSVASESADFGDVTTGTVSEPKTLTVTNTSSGTTAEDLRPAADGLVVSGDGFAVVDDGCSGKTVAPGATCTFAVRFAPTVAGAAHGMVTLTTNAPAPAKVTLSGNGVAPPPAEHQQPALSPPIRLSGLSATRCLGPGPGAKRSVTINYTLNRTAKVTFTLQRRVKPALRARSCPKVLRPGGGAGSYVGVRTGKGGTAARAAAAGRALTKTITVRKLGRQTLKLTTLTGKVKLATGRYRVLIRATAADGTRAEKAVYFWVMPRRKP